MAISILSVPDFLQPVYSVQEYELYDSVNHTQNGFYYRLIITVGSETRTVDVAKDENNKAVINVKDLLTPFVESTFCVGSSLLSPNTDLLTIYTVQAYSIWNTGSSGSSISTRVVFNGIDRFDSQWDTSMHELRTDSSGLFITAYHGERDMTIDDFCKLQFLYGQVNGIDSSFNGLNITRTQLNGDVSTFIYDYPVSFAGVTFFEVTIGKDSINSESSGFIDSSTVKITVAERRGLSETLAFNIVQPDNRFNRYYRVQYIDHLGSTDYYNFTKSVENNINISSTEYVNNRNLTKFSTQVEDEYTINTNWIGEDRSLALKDLWYSPKVAVAENWSWLDVPLYHGFAPIIIKDKTKQILNRHNVKGAPPIKYNMNFRYSKEYQVQYQ